jgi:hypothetical protein
MSSQLVLQAEQQYPVFRSEYIQVLVFVVCPLIILLSAILIDLTFERRIRVHNGETTFRASLAVRCAWIFVIAALLGNALFSVGTKYIVIVADLLAVFELVRTFPTNITIGNEGIKWGTLWTKMCLPWEKVYCFVKKKSLPGAEEYRLYGTDGQTLVLSRMVHPDSKKIAQWIAFQLRLRHLTFNDPEPQSVMNGIHRLIAVACAVVIVFGRYLGR